MKTIGMIGGTGWVSTVEYYRLINEITNERRGGLRFRQMYPLFLKLWRYRYI